MTLRSARGFERCREEVVIVEAQELGFSLVTPSDRRDCAVGLVESGLARLSFSAWFEPGLGSVLLVVMVSFLRGMDFQQQWKV